MNIVLSPSPAVLTPLQGLWRWFTAIAARNRATVASRSPCVREFSVNSSTSSNRHHQLEQSKSAGLSIRRPLRIVHILEAGQTPVQGGRMVISGRMADVCAELDRLAAREATLH